MLQEKKDKFEKELILLKNNVYQLKSEMNLSQSELDLYVSSEKKVVQQLSSLESSYEQTIQTCKKDEKLLHEEQEQIRKLENELSSLNPQLADTIENEKNIAEEIRSCRLKLEEAKNSFYTSRHHSSMMQAFMKEKANGR
ncbi:Structural maintenance of chromosomes protein 4, partial [Stegodyphus mimosarum]